MGWIVLCRMWGDDVMSKLPKYCVKLNKENWYEVYIILYASEIDYHPIATFKWEADMLDFTKGDF